MLFSPLSKPSTLHPSRNLIDYQSESLVQSHTFCSESYKNVGPLQFLLHGLLEGRFQEGGCSQNHFSESFGLMLKDLKICLNTIQCNKYSVNTFLVYAKYNRKEKCKIEMKNPSSLPSSRTDKISAPINGYCTTLKQNLLMVILLCPLEGSFLLIHCTKHYLKIWMKLGDLNNLDNF